MAVLSGKRDHTSRIHHEGGPGYRRGQGIVGARVSSGPVLAEQSISRFL
jgi:hypothetical protein